MKITTSQVFEAVQLTPVLYLLFFKINYLNSTTEERKRWRDVAIFYFRLSWSRGFAEKILIRRDMCGFTAHLPLRKNIYVL